MAVGQGAEVTSYYFGCYGGIGHYLFSSEGMQSVSRSKAIEIFGKEWWLIDGAFVPTNDGVIAHGYTFDTFLTSGWTYLSMIDNTVDHRQGSHSTFLLLGKHSKLEATQLVRVAFPEVCKRISL